MTTSWNIVFITGMSEYNNSTGLDALAREAGSRHIHIYTLGVDIPNPTNPRTTQAEQSDLNLMSGRSYKGVFYSLTSAGAGTGITSTIRGILEDACNDISSQPVAKDVVVTDSIYPYLTVTGTSITPDSNLVNVNKDGVTTLVWKLGDMPPSQTRTIIINTALNFNKLPIDVSNKTRPVSFVPSTSTPPSVVTFTAMSDSPGVKPRNIWLPEGELNVFCGSPPCPPEVKTTPAPSAPEANNTSAVKTTETKKQPGFEVWAAMLGLMGVVYLLRRKDEGA